MIDSHCHLSDVAFVPDLAAVVGRARAAGLVSALMVLPPGDEAEAARADKVLALWPEVRLAVGIHPHQAGAYSGPEADVTARVRAALEAAPLARAVGEIGLDYHYSLAPYDVQRRVFRAQVRLARALGLPMVIHTREAEDDTRLILGEECGGRAAGVLHCFTGTESFAGWALDLGLHISFAGIVTFPRADALRALSARVPAERLLVETDCPYLAPLAHRGRRNEPAWVVGVAETLAEVRHVERDVLAEQVTANFVGLFRP